MASVGVGGSNEEINPGLSINTVVSFDVPPGTAPDYLEVHDSMFGVDLGGHHFADPARRWAVRLDTGGLVVADTDQLVAE